MIPVSSPCIGVPYYCHSPPLVNFGLFPWPLSHVGCRPIHSHVWKLVAYLLPASFVLDLCSLHDIVVPIPCLLRELSLSAGPSPTKVSCPYRWWRCAGVCASWVF